MDKKIVFIIVILALITLVVFYQLTGKTTARIKYGIQGSELEKNQDYSLNKGQEMRIYNLLKNLDELRIKLKKIDKNDKYVILDLVYGDYEKEVEMNINRVEEFDLNKDSTVDISIELTGVPSIINAEFEIKKL